MKALAEHLQDSGHRALSAWSVSRPEVLVAVANGARLLPPNVGPIPSAGKFARAWGLPNGVRQISEHFGTGTHGDILLNEGVLQQWSKTKPRTFAAIVFGVTSSIHAAPSPSRAWINGAPKCSGVYVCFSPTMPIPLDESFRGDIRGWDAVSHTWYDLSTGGDLEGVTHYLQMGGAS